MPATSNIKFLTFTKHSLLTLLITTFAAPLSATANTTKTPPTPYANDAAWHFRVAPYLWALNMSGTTQIGARRVHVDESFSDILNHLDFAGMLWLEAEKGKLGIFLNSLYAVLSDSASDAPLSLNARVQYGIFAGGLSYVAYQTNQFSIAPYAGFRYTLNHNKLTLNAPIFSITAKRNISWTDPLIGARLLYELNKAWSFTLAGDIGGTNATTDYSYNITGLIGYHPQTMMTYTTIYFGYRQLDQNYQTGSGTNKYVWDMKIRGPLLGIAFDF
jgi:hypothetical protein